MALRGISWRRLPAKAACPKNSLARTQKTNFHSTQRKGHVSKRCCERTYTHHSYIIHESHIPEATVAEEKKRYRRFRRLLNRLDVFFVRPSIWMNAMFTYILDQSCDVGKNGIVIVCGLEKKTYGMPTCGIFDEILLVLGSRLRDDSVMKVASCKQHYGHYMGCLTE